MSGNTYYLFLLSLSLLCAVAAYSLASGKGRSALGWAFLCLSFPLFLLLLAILPIKSTNQNYVPSPLVYGGLLGAVIVTFLGAASITGADTMILRGNAFPECGDNDAKVMVVTKWASEHMMSGSSPIVGLSAEKMMSENPTVRVCEADTASMDGSQHHIKFTMTRLKDKAPEVTSVVMTR